MNMQFQQGPPQQPPQGAPRPEWERSQQQPTPQQQPPPYQQRQTDGQPPSPAQGPQIKRNGRNGGAPAIECLDLVKAFGANKVLDGVTCNMPSSQITVVMGPSGTGKSVLLRHVVGLLFPDAGDVIVDGKHVPKLSDDELLEMRRGIGMLFQDGALFSSMNLYDNVAFPLRQHTNHSESKVREIVTQRLKEVGLSGAEHKMPNELSGGMRKRAGFARALVLEPKILLFDEPDSGLDPVRTALLCDLIKEIQRRNDATALVISHDIKSCYEIADHVVLLHGGKVIDQGPKEAIQNSQNEFTQQFIKGQVQGPLGMD